MPQTVAIGDSTVPRIGLGSLYITEERGFGTAFPLRENVAAGKIELEENDMRGLWPGA